MRLFRPFGPVPIRHAPVGTPKSLYIARLFRPFRPARPKNANPEEKKIYSPVPTCADSLVPLTRDSYIFVPYTKRSNVRRHRPHRPNMFLFPQALQNPVGTVGTIGTRQKSARFMRGDGRNTVGTRSEHDRSTRCRTGPPGQCETCARPADDKRRVSQSTREILSASACARPVCDQRIGRLGCAGDGGVPKRAPPMPRTYLDTTRDISGAAAINRE